MAELRGRVVATEKISAAMRREMFALFQRYYEQVDFERFEADLRPKQFVILLFDSENRVQGFSTLQHLLVYRNGRPIRGIFSGDTVIDEREVRVLIPELRKAGAQGIIEYPLNKVIR